MESINRPEGNERFKVEAYNLLVCILKNGFKSPEFLSKTIEEHLRKAYWEGQLAGYKEGKSTPEEWSDK
jgi:hypothetical protein